MCAVVAAAAVGVEAIDTVFTDIADLDGLRRECEDGVAMGFTGKISIHPTQIPVINEVFTPSKESVDEARQLIGLFEEHARRGVVRLHVQGPDGGRPAPRAREEARGEGGRGVSPKRPRARG